MGATKRPNESKLREQMNSHRSTGNEKKASKIERYLTRAEAKRLEKKIAAGITVRPTVLTVVSSDGKYHSSTLGD